MKLFFFFILFSVFALNANAGEKDYFFTSFNHAESSQEYIRFDMESTKLGFITTSFKGFVKKFKVIYQKKKNTLSNMKVTFQVEALDADGDSRNEKMHDLCFNKKDHPQIELRFKGPIKIGEEIKMRGFMTLRGEQKVISVKLKTRMNEGKIDVSGSSEVSLKKLGIPDPSIAVASVRDTVEIKFEMSL